MVRSDISRRSVLASLGAAPMVPVLAKAVTQDSSQSIQTELVVSALLQLRLAAPVDALSGVARIVGGKASGLLAAEVQPGSFTWTRDTVRGALELTSRFDLQTPDGTRIHVTDRGVVATESPSCWEAPISTATELTPLEGVYVGRMDASQIHLGHLRLEVHRVI